MIINSSFLHQTKRQKKNERYLIALSSQDVKSVVENVRKDEVVLIVIRVVKYVQHVAAQEKSLVQNVKVKVDFATR